MPLKSYVVHTSWEVRIAAASAVEVISKEILSQSNDIYVNLAVQKTFIQKQLNFGLQERVTGIDPLVQEEDFNLNYSYQNSSVNCLSSAELQEVLFGNCAIYCEQNTEPTCSKRRKSSPSPSISLAEGQTAWPFSEFYDWLLEQSFEPNWENRHGAITALRELLKGNPSSKKEQDDVNEYYLQFADDLCVRLLALIALDRFGDYVSDEVTIDYTVVLINSIYLT
ncbi:unnamed protein product [Didymodactylos carnosus]|uniref:Uncharacterized protein n=1 Tax=Didymodactylos carnosus TaxID=1234261 RepID=A0A813ZTJ6_9BILA|nr:unnamed protein product [Didymodactylos carnosus]CAF0903322.1 unnamed protein product [Didymodactylos carnosus]CAF3676432.1 unnamed protein product [Didymodactylos carnosus]CAF3685495.1 unnamed protein product [Didymodactylos carnosus]